MPCFSPLHAYRSLTEKTDNGKSVISFHHADGYSSPYENIRVPCGQCLGCKIDRSRSWAVRCVHEASLYEHNTFLTLTFNDEHLDPTGSLVRADFQKFMKRLRKDNKGLQYVQPEAKRGNPYPIRYFHCGEYGDEMGRPHHHACIFNFEFLDAYYWTTKKSVDLYRSPSLEKLWPYGFSSIGEINFDSAAYIARYLCKKYNGEHAASHYIRGDPDSPGAYYLEPEYITMSTNPGIAKNWIRQNIKGVYPKDYLTLAGKKFKPPGYYDSVYDEHAPAELAKLKHKRKLVGIANKDDNTYRRLRAKRQCAEARNATKLREYENGNQTLHDL